MNAISTETVIINLLRQDETTYLSVKRLFRLERFIWNKLKELGELDNYRIDFDISFDAVERTVMYHNKIFDLDINGEVIYLKEKLALENNASNEKYSVDTKILGLIQEFCNAA